MTIPIVFIHKGNQDYLHHAIQHVKKHCRRVVLIGDDTNLSAGAHEHYNIQDLYTPELRIFETQFTNYSSNSADYERFCFSRMFILREWMRVQNLKYVVHLDSDCIILDNVDKLFDGTLAYMVIKDNDNIAAGNIAISCVTTEFLDVFVQLCFDIYVNKTKLHIIQPKIDFHRQTGSPGGICDMTLYYFISKMIPVINLTDLRNDMSSFDINIHDPYGFNGDYTYKLVSGVKELEIKDNTVYAKTVDGKPVRLNNLHFQGNGKRLLKAFTSMLHHQQTV